MAILNHFGTSDIIILSLIFIILYISRFYYNYFARNNPLPGPFPLPFIGNAHLFKRNQYGDWIVKQHQKYGSIFEIYIFSRRIIYVSTLEMIDPMINSSTIKTSKFRLRYEKLDNLEEFGTSGKGVVFNYDLRSWKYNKQFFIQSITSHGFL